MDLESAYAALFRNVKVEQPGETYLPFECIDAGIVDNKRLCSISSHTLAPSIFFNSIFFSLHCFKTHPLSYLSPLTQLSLSTLSDSRQMKLKFTPSQAGKHVFQIFDEVDGKVSSYPFSVVTQESANDVIKQREERRKQYREQEEKARKLERERREKAKELKEREREEVKRMGEAQSVVAAVCVLRGVRAQVGDRNEFVVKDMCVCMCACVYYM